MNFVRRAGNQNTNGIMDISENTESYLRVGGPRLVSIVMRDR